MSRTGGGLRLVRVLETTPPHGDTQMKYMLMMHYGADCGGFPPIHTWDPKDIQAHIAFMLALNERLSKRGEFVDAQGLTDPGQAKLVRARQGGGPAITDGPFPEGKEFLAGFWIVDVETEG